jgi:hypothetical protein
MMTIPMTLEVARRICRIWTGNDLGAQLNTKNLSQLIEGSNEQNPYHLAPLRMKTRDEIKSALSDKMEQFQSDMGVEAALETFKLMHKILAKEENEEQLKLAKKKVAEWNYAQHVRAVQQILCFASFGISMAALRSTSAAALKDVQTLALAGGNAIPFYMDAFWPFKRNTLIVVPKVETEEFI